LGVWAGILGNNRAGAFAQPALRQRGDVGALRGVEAAAGVADEDHDGLVGLRIAIG